MLKDYMKNLYEAVAEEQTDYKQPWETQEEVDGFRLCSFFNYYYANGVYAERIEDNLTVGWEQYENQLYIEGPNFDSKQYTLTRQEELTANIEEVRNMLPSILAEGKIENFPVSQFLEAIDKINKDILENYPIYWDEEHQGHRKAAVLGEDIDQTKDNIALEFETQAKELGFELEDTVEEDIINYVKFKNANYTHYLQLKVWDEQSCQLKYEIYPDSQELEPTQYEWFVNDVEDVKKAFEVIKHQFEGLE